MISKVRPLFRDRKTTVVPAAVTTGALPPPVVSFSNESFEAFRKLVCRRKQPLPGFDALLAALEKSCRLLLSCVLSTGARNPGSLVTQLGMQQSAQGYHFWLQAVEHCQ